MRPTAWISALCLLTLGAAGLASAADTIQGRALALARGSDCFREQVLEARRAGRILGTPAVIDNEDGTFAVSVSSCPPCALDAEPCAQACDSLVAIVDPATRTVECGD